MITPWAFWHPRVLPIVPGAPAPYVDQALRTAARKFFRDTRAWVQWLEPTRIGSGAEHEFELPAESELLSIERATHDGRPFAVQAIRHLSADPATHPMQTSRSMVSGNLRSFMLTGDVVAPANMQALVVLIPSVTSRGVPTELAERHQEAIGEGALAELLLTPNTTFFSPDLAAVSHRRFATAADSASTLAYRSHTKHVPRTQPKWC